MSRSFLQRVRLDMPPVVSCENTPVVTGDDLDWDSLPDLEETDEDDEDEDEDEDSEDEEEGVETYTSRSNRLHMAERADWARRRQRINEDFMMIEELAFIPPELARAGWPFGKLPGVEKENDEDGEDRDEG